MRSLGCIRALRAAVVAVMLLLPASWSAAAATASVTGVSVGGDDARWDLFDLGAGSGRPDAEVVKSRPDDVFPFLPGEQPGRSVSVGTVTDGRLINGLPLALPGRAYGVLPRQYRRRLLYGTEELITAVVGAAEYVERVYPGSVLWLGNIGRRGGGDIPWSVSHNSGRDADLAFYTIDPNGRVVEPPDLLHYGPDARSREYGGFYRFDDARNWALVKALTLSPHVQVQFLFISNPLRRRLIEHARRIGEAPAVVERAARLMQQPGPAIPHDDHLHVRVYCSALDVTGGCVNTGRTHPGVDLHRAARTARIEHATSLLRAGNAETRESAVRRLAVLAADSGVDAIRRRLSDPSPVVRAAAVDALAELGSDRIAGWLVMHWEDEDSAFVRERMVRALGALGGRDAGLFFASALATAQPVTVAGKSYDLRLEIVDAVRRSGRAEPAYVLVGLLKAEDVELRARAASALRRLANRDVDGREWRQALATHEVESAASEWQDWVEGAAASSRDQWVSEGFALLGVPSSGRPVDVAAGLARLVGDERTWVSHNAQEALMRMTGNRPRSMEWPRSDARTYWTRWVSRNTGRISNY